MHLQLIVSDRIWRKAFKFFPKLSAFSDAIPSPSALERRAKQQQSWKPNKCWPSPLKEPRSLARVQRGQFPEPKETLGTTKAPSGRTFSNLHSTGKLHALASFNPSLWAFLTCNSSEEPRFWGASAFQQAKRVKAGKEGPPHHQDTLHTPEFPTVRRPESALDISQVLQAGHLSESFTLLTEAGLGNSQLLYVQFL